MTRPAKARRILVVRVHPLLESFVGAAGQRAVTAFGASGHEVRVIDPYEDGFDPVIGDGPPRGVGVLPAGLLVGYVESVRWCDTIVFAYPTWFGSQPAMLKGWLDAVLVEGVAFDQGGGQVRSRTPLRNIRRIVVITSHGSPKWMNALQGEPGKRTLLRGFRSFCHPLTRSEWVAFYDNDGCDQRARADFLNRVEAVALRV